MHDKTLVAFQITDEELAELDSIIAERELTRSAAIRLALRAWMEAQHPKGDAVVVHHHPVPALA